MTAGHGDQRSGADALARVREAGGQELVERLVHRTACALRRAHLHPRRALPTSARSPTSTWSSQAAALAALRPVLAAHGLRVAVLERARAGAVHREWNASGPELQALVRAGLVEATELEALVLARYRAGVCRWHGGGEYAVRGVLDHAVDAAALLEHARRLALARGVEIHDGTELEALAEGPSGVALAVRASGVARTLTARLLVDGRARATWATPTWSVDRGWGDSGLAAGDGRDGCAPMSARSGDHRGHRRRAAARLEAFPGVVENDRLPLPLRARGRSATR